MSTTSEEIKEELQKAHPDDLEAIRFYVLYMQCTKEEREELTIDMMRTIENRKRDSVELFKRDPDMLKGLSVSRLREVASLAIEDAHKWILESVPPVAAFLNAFECLYSFTVGTEETISFMEFADVITSLREVWSNIESVSASDTTRESVPAKMEE